MEARLNKAKVALVAGDDDLLNLVRMVLASDAFELMRLSNGRAGLMRLQQDPPHLIILDLALPDMNGWEFFMQMQSEDGQPQALRHVPVIILANQASRVDRTFGLRVAQVHDFIVKPFLPSQLRRSVAEALKDLAPARYQLEIAQYGA